MAPNNPTLEFNILQGFKKVLFLFLLQSSSFKIGYQFKEKVLESSTSSLLVEGDVVYLPLS